MIKYILFLIHIHICIIKADEDEPIIIPLNFYNKRVDIPFGIDTEATGVYQGTS